MDVNGIWFYVNLLASPQDQIQLEPFIKDVILKQLREKYSHLNLETREALLLAYEDKIKVLRQSSLMLKIYPIEYEKRINTYLERWITDINDYLPRIVRLARNYRRTNVLCIDNVDQLPPEYQSKIFLIAQQLSRELEAVVIVALREESYYSASIRKVFTAYNNRTFHIASPPFRELISLRLNYCREMLSLSPEEVVIRLGTGIEFDRPAVQKFLDIIQYSIFYLRTKILLDLLSP